MDGLKSPHFLQCLQNRKLQEFKWAFALLQNELQESSWDVLIFMYVKHTNSFKNIVLCYYCFFFWLYSGFTACKNMILVPPLMWRPLQLQPSIFTRNKLVDQLSVPASKPAPELTSFKHHGHSIFTTISQCLLSESPRGSKRLIFLAVYVLAVYPFSRSFHANFIPNIHLFSSSYHVGRAIVFTQISQAASKPVWSEQCL